MRQAVTERSPDGALIVPYVLFIVRPDGIRPYYEARAQLEQSGITFGYELVEQDWKIDYPDLRDVEEWYDAASPPCWPQTHQSPRDLADHQLLLPPQAQAPAREPARPAREPTSKASSGKTPKPAPAAGVPPRAIPLIFQALPKATVRNRKISEA